MICYKLIISYDGTEYCGWQWQPNLCSIDSIFKEVFFDVFQRELLYFVGASRTDSGVHANGQVARMLTNLKIEPIKMKKALNGSLPKDIRVIEIVVENRRFHPQHNVKLKEYSYRVSDDKINVFMLRYCWQLKNKINLEKLDNALSVFEGTYDFSMFSKKNELFNSIKTINKIERKYCAINNIHIIKIIGKSFLHNMIRRIVGASVEYSIKEDLTLSDIKLALNSVKIAKHLPCAPAHGLCLEKIIYEENFGDYHE